MDNKIKVMAFYLPQFHTIPENDEWWGKGFTDWVNVKKGVKYRKGQEQPRVPLNNNYYDLTDVKTIRWQSDLVNDYGMYGLCFYHYWFNGKLLLEKPAELLLENKDINLKFCFSWANEPWSRTWSGNNKQVLISQSYGDKSEWKAHFNYLLPFFNDGRYIKEDNRPMFLIYRSLSIPCCKEMMEMWEELAKEAGFKGMHFVETLRGDEEDKRDLPFKAKVEFEPRRSINPRNYIYITYGRIRRRVLKLTNKIFGTSFPLEPVIKYEEATKGSLEMLSPVGTYGGVFVGWDNTARRGLASTIVLPPSKEEFYEYLKKKVKITKEIYQTDYVFVNAWNEWAEGTYLEPDETHKFEYLEMIKKIVDSDKKQNFEQYKINNI